MPLKGDRAAEGSSDRPVTPPHEHGGTELVIGAGPAGLTAAYLLAKADVPVTVVEADGVVGGISRTVERDGWRFDIGGHRFFTKVAAVEALWDEILPTEDFLLRPRLSRIYYRGRFFDYPLRPVNALRSLGVIEAARCVASYGWARLHPPSDQDSFEGWTAARFGWRLYNTFFKAYTEKVWGVPATEIKADWAAQRIKNLSLLGAVLNAVSPRRNQTKVTSLIEQFHYPRLGPGMMWEEAARKASSLGARILLDTRVVRLVHERGRVVYAEVDQGGRRSRIEARDVISSMPLSELVLAMDPPPPPEVREAAVDLHYRAHITVALVVGSERGFPDNWIYVHAPEVRLGRVQNFGSWSPDMVKEGKACLGLEYFVHETDRLWKASDDELIALGTHELAIIGLAREGDVEAGYVARMPKAYPVYDEGYDTHIATIRKWLEDNATNVQPVGRNGMHKYNNQDHSAYTAMLAVDSIITGNEHDIWSVNVDDEYAEEVSSTGRDAPVIPVHPSRLTGDR